MRREWIFDQLDNHIRRDMISALETRSSQPENESREALPLFRFHKFLGELDVPR